MSELIGELSKAGDLPALQQGVENVRSNKAAATGEQDTSHSEKVAGILMKRGPGRRQSLKSGAEAFWVLVGTAGWQPRF